MTKPLILAIEPNKTQAQQIAALVKQHVRAELVSAASVAAALDALGDRIPDLVLTPALLSPQDEVALAGRLRGLGPAAAHVHTLAVPIMASGKPRIRDSAAGLLGRRRHKPEPVTAVGCDPAMFAEQIKVYLDRAARDRGALPDETSQPPAPHHQVLGIGGWESGVARPAAFDPPAIEPPVPPREPEPAVAETAPAPVDDFDEMEEIVWLPETLTPSEVEGLAPSEVDGPAPGNVDEPLTSSVEERQVRTESEATRALAHEFGLPPAVSTSPPLWRITEEGLHAFDAPAPPEEPAEPVETEPAEPVVHAAAPLQIGLEPVLPPAPVLRTSRPRKDAPPVDDWAYFDPTQMPFRALVAALDRLRDTAGSNLVEAAIITPLLVALSFSIVDLGSLFYAYLALENGVAEATRYGVTGARMDDPDNPGTKLSREGSLKQAMKNATPSLNLDEALLTFSHLSPGGGQWQNGAGGPSDIDRLTVTYKWDLMTPVLRPFFPDGKVALRVESAMKNEVKFE